MTSTGSGSFGVDSWTTPAGDTFTVETYDSDISRVTVSSVDPGVSDDIVVLTATRAITGGSGNARYFSNVGGDGWSMFVDLDPPPDSTSGRYVLRLEVGATVAVPAVAGVLGTWYVAIGVARRTTALARLYLNGVPSSDATTPVGLLGEGNNLAIGGTPAPIQEFLGSIHVVCVWYGSGIANAWLNGHVAQATSLWMG